VPVRRGPHAERGPSDVLPVTRAVIALSWFGTGTTLEVRCTRARVSEARVVPVALAMMVRALLCVVFAGLIGCGSEGHGEETSVPNCAPAKPSNPTGCPDSYDHALSGKPCTVKNLGCTYPGAGDQSSGGCPATAGLQCVDRGTDGGTALQWVASQ
jgi:hypothetical protein